MAFQTGVLILMTRLAPLGLVGRLVGVLKPPVGRMDLGKGDFALMA